MSRGARIGVCGLGVGTSCDEGICVSVWGRLGEGKERKGKEKKGKERKGNLLVK